MNHTATAINPRAARPAWGIRFRFALGALALTLMFGLLPARSEPPSTSYIFPAGGQRGTRVQARVGGHYLNDTCRFTLEGAGVTAPAELRRGQTFWLDGPIIPFPASSRKEDYPKDYPLAVTIAADAALGNRHWYATTAQGTTTARVFVVGDLPEVVEEELPGEPLPVEVKLPVTINGRIFPHEDVDLWEFHAEQGQTIGCRAATTSIGSPLEARLFVLDAGGQTVAESSGGLTSEPTVRFPCAASGTYRVRIEDANFSGLQHYVYRLTLSAAPAVEAVFPAGGRRGSKVVVQLLGLTEPTSVQLDTAADAPALERRRASLAATGNGAPSATDSPSATDAFVWAAGDHPEFVEREPNETPEQAIAVAAPSTLNGRIDRGGDVDLWKFTARKDQPLELDVLAERLGSPLDAQLTVRNADGKVLVTAGEGASAFDPRLRFQPPADGQYTVEIAEQFANRGGPTFVYRLSIAPAQSDFQLTLPSDALTVLRGGEQKLVVQVQRRGFDGPIKLRAEFPGQEGGVPDDVQVAEVEVKKKQTKATLTFKAGAAAKMGLHSVQIVGSAQLAAAGGKDGGAEQESKTIERTARWSDADPTLPPPLHSDRLRLAVAMPTPFKFIGSFDLRYVPRGGVLRKTFQLQRNGYDGPLTIELADRQARHLQGVVAQKIQVSGDAEQFEFAVRLPPWMELNRTSRSVIMASAVVRDEDGQPHTVTYTSGVPNDQLIAIVSPSLMRLVPSPRSAVAKPGETVEVEVQIKRSSAMDQPVRLELVMPSHLSDIDCSPVLVPPVDSAGRLQIRLGDRPGPLNLPLVIRATIGQGNDAIVAESKFEFVAP